MFSTVVSTYPGWIIPQYQFTDTYRYYESGVKFSSWKAYLVASYMLILSDVNSVDSKTVVQYNPRFLPKTPAPVPKGYLSRSRKLRLLFFTSNNGFNRHCFFLENWMSLWANFAGNYLHTVALKVYQGSTKLKKGLVNHTQLYLLGKGVYRNFQVSASPRVPTLS